MKHQRRFAIFALVNAIGCLIGVSLTLSKGQDWIAGIFAFEYLAFAGKGAFLLWVGRPGKKPVKKITEVEFCIYETMQTKRFVWINLLIVGVVALCLERSNWPWVLVCALSFSIGMLNSGIAGVIHSAWQSYHVQQTRAWIEQLKTSRPLTLEVVQEAEVMCFNARLLIPDFVPIYAELLDLYLDQQIEELGIDKGKPH